MNSVQSLWILLLIGVALVTFIECTPGGTVSCYQCNIFNRGAREFCENAERKMYNCSGCLKTQTRVYLHDRWLQFKYVTVISKYCIQFMNHKLDEGCYTKSGDQGYTRRCYCYSHWCNTANKISNRTPVFVGLQVLFTSFVLSWIRGS